ncbi:LysR substrate-binding domain-containing protein [Ruegeria atlantica]|uniref:LysR substrate-binding domain-containing protein n=1 Tax=Ruegeria atlantica TaxID=81569 RepID=UPI0024954304|nr:LysR substrate-binding domain-containing protein [Ruegeria atlantica]
MKITFKQVDAFRTVVSTGTVTEAAAMLGISQPAVSRLISDFEAEVGFQLFQRSGRVLVPTDEARLLVEEVRQAVSGMEHIKDSATAIGKFGHARLNLVITPGVSSQLAPDLLQEFSATWPKAMARMEIAPSDDAVEWMVSQNYDFGITTTQPANPSFDSLVIRNSDVCCVVPTGHPLAEKTIVQAQDLAGKSFISYMPSSRFRFEIDQFFEAKGISRQMQYETRTTDAVCRLVARGLGVSVVGASLDYLKTIPDCVALPFAAPLTFRAVLFWSKNKPLSAVGQSFLKIVQSQISDD